MASQRTARQAGPPSIAGLPGKVVRPRPRHHPFAHRSAHPMQGMKNRPKAAPPSAAAPAEGGFAEHCDEVSSPSGECVDEDP
eukprot:15469058-Alexandrium_andersonii.AAC.1